MVQGRVSWFLGWSGGSWCSGVVGDAREVSLGGCEVGGLHLLFGYIGFGSNAGKAVL